MLKEGLDYESLLPSLGIEVISVSGDEILCRCPDPKGNHKRGDVNPSFYFNKRKHVANCFVCGGWSLLSLVKDVLGISEAEAINWIESQERKDNSPDLFLTEIDALLNKREKEAVFPIFNKTFAYDFVHPYLYERGLSDDVIFETRVGWSPEHNGICIPHYFRGVLVGMQFRHLEKREDVYVCPTCGNNAPKYVNTDGFPKSETLYLYDRAVSLNEPVVLVESPFTTLYLVSNGINSVASFGASISKRQCELLRVFWKGVYIWSDNDKAGKKMANNTILMLEKYVPLYVVPEVPGEKSDPADVPSDSLFSFLRRAKLSELNEFDI